MYQDSKEIRPLDWQTLVNEALRRRKAEKITQREHAALANVSVPTMAAFERGEKSLTLAKALDILSVVGLVHEPEETNAQDVFVKEAFDRWRELTNSLPKDAPACLPHGYFRFDYCLEGIKLINLKHLPNILTRSVETHYSGWPPFLLGREKKNQAYEKGDTIERWIVDTEEVSYLLGQSNDFWRASPQGRMFLIRGYKEDGPDISTPGSIFDISIPVYRMAEVLLHASHMATHMPKEDSQQTIVHFRVLYTGLRGRVLRSWSDPHYFLPGEYSSLSSEALVETSVSVEMIQNNLIEVIYPLASSLYEKFGLIKLEKNLVQKVLDRLFEFARKQQTSP